MKMYKLGEKMEKGEVPFVHSNDVYYPSMNLSSDKCPEVKGMEIGETVTLKVVAKVRSINVNENEKEKRYDVGFDIHEIGIDDGKSKQYASEMAKQLKGK